MGDLKALVADLRAKAEWAKKHNDAGHTLPVAVGDLLRLLDALEAAEQRADRYEKGLTLIANLNHDRAIDGHAGNLIEIVSDGARKVIDDVRALAADKETGK